MYTCEGSEGVDFMLLRPQVVLGGSWKWDGGEGKAAVVYYNHFQVVGGMNSILGV